MHGPAFSTVTGTTCPSARNTCVIPIFLPKIPGLIFHSRSRSLARPPDVSAWPLAPGPWPLLTFSERLDFHVHAGRKIQLHQRIHGVLGRLENIEQTLVRADLKL